MSRVGRATEKALQRVIFMFETANVMYTNGPAIWGGCVTRRSIRAGERTKIGLNMHISYGPINTRLYQLPANGVMQICDCKKGLGDVFEIDKEIIAYKSINEAIELIKYYLSDEKERENIALAGYRRVMTDYRRVSTFSHACHLIGHGLCRKGINTLKDGTPISTILTERNSNFGN